MQLGSRVAVALVEAGGYSSDLTSSQGTSICCRSGLRKAEKTNKQTNKQKKPKTFRKYCFHFSDFGILRVKHESSSPLYQ